MSTPKPEILILTHAATGMRIGNRGTALRWLMRLRRLGARVRIANEYNGEHADVMLALHARRTLKAQRAFVEQGGGKLSVMLTGTDIYQHWPDSAELDFAQRHISSIIALQDDMRARLPHSLQSRCKVIMQSATFPATTPAKLHNSRTDKALHILLSGHLRHEKDPFLAVHSLHTHLPASTMQIRHCGGELEPGFSEQARQWQVREPRYIYLGELSRQAASQQLLNADVLVNASRIEGGPAIVTEAIVAGIPVLASAIPAHRGLLGTDYAGLFPVGDSEALATLLKKLQDEPAFSAHLKQQIARRAPLFTPEQECAAIGRWLQELLATENRGDKRLIQ